MMSSAPLSVSLPPPQRSGCPSYRTHNFFSAYLDMLRLEVDHGDGKGFIFLANDTTPGYVDIAPSTWSAISKRANGANRSVLSWEDKNIRSSCPIARSNSGNTL